MGSSIHMRIHTMHTDRMWWLYWELDQPESHAVAGQPSQEEPETMAVIDSSSVGSEPLSEPTGQPQEPTATQLELLSRGLQPYLARLAEADERYPWQSHRLELQSDGYGMIAVYARRCEELMESYGFYGLDEIDQAIDKLFQEETHHE